MANVTGRPITLNPQPRLLGAASPFLLWLAYAAIAAAGLFGLTVVYLVDPRNPGTYPVCPFFGLTGCYCPGCGALRALHQLLHGNIPAAFGYNPFAVLALPALAYSFSVGWLRSAGWPAPRPIFVPAYWIWAFLVAVLSFWLLRNLPFAPFSLLAP